MPFNLEEIDLAEISIVPDGGNQYADVVLQKQKGGQMTDEQTRRMKEYMADGMDEEQARQKAMAQDDDMKKAKEAQAEIAKRAEAAEKRVEALAKALDGAGYDVAEDGTVTKREAGDSIQLHGQTIFKNKVGAEVFEVMKAQADEVSKLKSEREAETLAKRADDELPNLSGSSKVRGAILKALDGIEDEEVRKAAHQSIKGASELAKMATKEFGHIAKEDDNSPSAQLDKLAKERAAKDGTTFAKAYTQVAAENPDIYKQMRTQ